MNVSYFYSYTNGMFASKAAAMVAVLAISAAAIMLYRLWLIRKDFGSMRFELYGWLFLLMSCLAANRVSVVLFYRGLIDSSAVWPMGASVGMGVALLGLARLYTHDKCGAKGWLFASALAVLAIVFG